MTRPELWTQTLTPETAKLLREPFPAEAIDQLPKPTRKNASKGRCDECDGWHGLPAVHLDYVGHAHVRDRLLQVDPAWSWEPFATDEQGLPRLRRNGDHVELWIWLWVDGVRKPGVGTVSADPRDGTEISKELISDALRNAAQSFGVALDLWMKTPPDIGGGSGDSPTSTGTVIPPSSAPVPRPPGRPTPKPSTGPAKRVEPTNQGSPHCPYCGTACTHHPQPKGSKKPVWKCPNTDACPNPKSTFSWASWRTDPWAAGGEIDELVEAWEHDQEGTAPTRTDYPPAEVDEAQLGAVWDGPPDEAPF